MDAVIIANEARDSILKRGVILCKLDIEKAYHHAESSFLLAVMEKMGFGGEVAKVDQVMFIHSQVFYFSKWNPFQVFFRALGV